MNIVRSSLLPAIAATAALFLAPSANAQFLYQAEYGTGTAFDGNIYTYTSGGAKSTFATGLEGPFGITFDASGNLYTTAENGTTPATGVIYKYTPGGVRSTFVASIPVAENPAYIAFASTGYMYAAYSNNMQNAGGILKIAPNGTYTTFATGISYAYGIAIDASDNVYVTSNDGNIYEYTPGGVKSTFFTYTTGLGGMEFDPVNGDLIAADTNDNKVISIAQNGSGYTTIASLPHGPNDVAVDASGNIFAVDDFAQVVYEYPAGGGQATFHNGGTLDAIGLAIYNPPTSQSAGTPEPGTVALFASLTLAGIGSLRARRRIASQSGS